MIDAPILAAIEARLTHTMGPSVTGLRRFEAAGVPLGFVDADRASRLAAFDCFHVTPEAIALDARLATVDARTAAIADVAATLRAEGALPAWRDEPYAVARAFGDTLLFLIERGAARYFGLRSYAAHVNGIVRDGNGTRMWLARRSDQKAVDPGMLDNLVGGGIAAGYGVAETVVKEAWEEAGISAGLARCARPAGIVHSRRPMFDGLQREVLFVHDLELPPGFTPANQDGEATEHRLVGLDEAARTIGVGAGRDQVTHDASVVTLDFLIRHGEIRPDQPCYVALSALRHPRL